MYAADIAATQIAEIKDLVKQEALQNIVVTEGAVSSINLPARVVTQFPSGTVTTI